MKKIILSALVLALTSGAAMADRSHGSGGHSSGGAHQGGVVVHGNGGHSNGGGGFHGNSGYHGNNGGYHGNSGWHGNTVVHNRGYEPRYYHTHGVARGNIWFNRPVIREHYYHYGYRPSLVVENYGPREGYIFVRGDWQWNGAEWLWMPGHYEPDQAYVEVY
jgi:hypothetical protein